MSVGNAASDATAFRQCRDCNAKLDYDVANRELMRKQLHPARMKVYCELRRKKNVIKKAKNEIESESENEIEMSESDTESG